MTNTKTCFACDGDYEVGYWTDHIFFCEGCAGDRVREFGIYDDGTGEYVVLNVIEVDDTGGEARARWIDSCGTIIQAEGDGELLTAAKALAAERLGKPYRVIDAEVQDGDTCRHVMVTVKAR